MSGQPTWRTDKGFDRCISSTMWEKCPTWKPEINYEFQPQIICWDLRITLFNMHLSEQHIQQQQLLRYYGQINQGVMNPQSQLLVLMCTSALIHLQKKDGWNVMMIFLISQIIPILQGTLCPIISKSLERIVPYLHKLQHKIANL